MSHKSPYISRHSQPAHSSPVAPSTTTAAYSDLHRAAHLDSSSDDDDIDPRFTSRRITQQTAHAPTKGGEGQASPKRRTASAMAGTTARPFSPARSSHPNFTRSGYTATPSVLDTSIGTSGYAGTTTYSAQEVHDRWKKGMGEVDTAADVTADGAAFSAIPVPQVDLTGMTEEQRELVEYYQARVEAFDRERVDFLQRLDDMSGNSREKHSLKWDLHKKDEQMMDLQKALSDAHVFLYEERAQVLKLTAENDRLKIQELEDRQRLEHLLALTQPINQEVTYFRECRPEKLTKNYPGQRDDIYSSQKDMSAAENAMDSPRRQVLNTSRTSARGADASNQSMLGNSASQLGSQSSAARGFRPASAKSKTAWGGAGGGGKGGPAMRPVVRTIYLPNENIDILKQIIASLRSQLTEQHTLFEQRIQALQEDRSIREQETAEVQRKANQHMQELAKELKAVNDLNKMTTRDYLELRHAAQLAERKLKERASSLSQQQFDLQKHLKDVESKAAMSETALQNENASYVSMFRQQTAATEEDLAIMKAQYAATQDLYEKRIRYLEGRIVTIKSKLRTVTDRRSLELEGYTTDITHLREKLRKLEQTLVNFKASQLGSSNGGGIDAEFERSTRGGRKASSSHHEHKEQSPQVPARVSATFELLGEDVRTMQSELAQMARKINSV